VVGGAEVAGEKIKEGEEAAKPTAKSAWESVKTFFTKPFSK
jgi:hypothetical protein